MLSECRSFRGNKICIALGGFRPSCSAETSAANRFGGGGVMEGVMEGGGGDGGADGTGPCQGLPVF